VLQMIPWSDVGGPLALPALGAVVFGALSLVRPSHLYGFVALISALAMTVGYFIWVSSCAPWWWEVAAYIGFFGAGWRLHLDR